MSDIIAEMGLDEEDLKWYQFAACNNMETNWFYDLYETDVHVAKQADTICLHCPVIKTCLKEGIRGREFGVWGGIHLNLGRVEKSTNAHKTEEVWSSLRELHGSSIV
jgi:hypothetical protein